MNHSRDELRHHLVEASPRLFQLIICAQGHSPFGSFVDDSCVLQKHSPFSRFALPRLLFYYYYGHEQIYFLQPYHIRIDIYLKDHSCYSSKCPVLVRGERLVPGLGPAMDTGRLGSGCPKISVRWLLVSTGNQPGLGSDPGSPRRLVPSPKR